MSNSGLDASCTDECIVLVHLPERLERRSLVAEDVAREPVGEGLGRVVVDEGLGGDREDLVAVSFLRQRFASDLMGL